jgi:hypothetical protein
MRHNRPSIPPSHIPVSLYLPRGPPSPPKKKNKKREVFDTLVLSVWDRISVLNFVDTVRPPSLYAQLATPRDAIVTTSGQSRIREGSQLFGDGIRCREGFLPQSVRWWLLLISMRCWHSSVQLRILFLHVDN